MRFPNNLIEISENEYIEYSYPFIMQKYSPNYVTDFSWHFHGYYKEGNDQVRYISGLPITQKEYELIYNTLNSRIFDNKVKSIIEE